MVNLKEIGLSPAVVAVEYLKPIAFLDFYDEDTRMPAFRESLHTVDNYEIQRGITYRPSRTSERDRITYAVAPLDDPHTSEPHLRLDSFRRHYDEPTTLSIIWTSQGERSDFIKSVGVFIAESQDSGVNIDQHAYLALSIGKLGNRYTEVYRGEHPITELDIVMSTNVGKRKIDHGMDTVTVGTRQVICNWTPESTRIDLRTGAYSDTGRMRELVESYYESSSPEIPVEVFGSALAIAANDEFQYYDSSKGHTKY